MIRSWISKYITFNQADPYPAGAWVKPQVEKAGARVSCTYVSYNDLQIRIKLACLRGDIDALKELMRLAVACYDPERMATEIKEKEKKRKASVVWYDVYSTHEEITLRNRHVETGEGAEKELEESVYWEVKETTVACEKERERIQYMMDEIKEGRMGADEEVVWGDESEDDEPVTEVIGVLVNDDGSSTEEEDTVTGDHEGSIDDYFTEDEDTVTGVRGESTDAEMTDNDMTDDELAETSEASTEVDTEDFESLTEEKKIGEVKNLLSAPGVSSISASVAKYMMQILDLPPRPDRDVYEAEVEEISELDGLFETGDSREKGNQLGRGGSDT
ncbi:hypothetical protein EJ08DRAFT_647042 [Tothia fuscella]|uniref:Uncharacterized protein n=1 Tax=Tothia fuscella TaxID=1048955 RepID=A0A9P4NY01_9PEZI|nr:hypothetical protein EJ08DRAFT_647042 [Tothia fuscella]